MRRIKSIVLVGGLLMLAVSVASASASANTFQFNYTGTGASKAKFTLSSGAVKLVSVKGNEWSCSSSTGTGEIGGASGSSKVTDVLVKLSGCKLVGKQCTTAGQAEGVMESGELEGELGYLAKGEAGLLLTAKSGSFMGCKAGLSVIEFKGGLIGQVTPVNTKSKAFTVGYRQGLGRQALTKFSGGVENVLQESFSDGEAWEGAGVEAGLTVKPLEGEIEIAEVA